MTSKPFIVPGVCRYTLEATLFGRSVFNVLDYEVDTTGSTQSRHEAIHDLAGILINEWIDSMIPLFASEYVAQKVSWVDLDDEDGSTGERTSSSGGSFPRAGGSFIQCSPSNVAVLVHKQIEGRRDRRNGRMYLGAVPEDVNPNPTPNVFTSSKLAIYNDKVSAFLGDTNQTDPIGGDAYGSRLCVVHITERYPLEEKQEIGTPKRGDHTNVAALVCDPMMATQRRRLRG